MLNTKRVNISKINQKIYYESTNKSNIEKKSY